MSQDRERSGASGRYLWDRRGAPRLAEPFPALVRCRHCGAVSFEEETTLDNLSAFGLQARLVHCPEIGDHLFVIVRFTLDAALREPGPGVAARGFVMRRQPCADGLNAIAMVFVRHRLLFAPV